MYHGRDLPHWPQVGINNIFFLSKENTSLRRTAAGSAAATNALVKTDARNLVVFGAGLQARLHVEAMLCVRGIVSGMFFWITLNISFTPSAITVTVVNRTLDRAQELCTALATSFRQVSFSAALLDSTQVCGLSLSDAQAHVDSNYQMREALAVADIVVTATDASKPLFDGTLLPPGCHINAIGSYTPTMQELDQTTVSRSSSSTSLTSFEVDS